MNLKQRGHELGVSGYVCRVLLMWLALSAGVGRGVAAEEALRWVDARSLTVEGQGWKSTRDPYDRLPARAEGMVTSGVWSLSHHSAGLVVRFESDASQLRVRWVLSSPSLAMPHMPATGVSGVDLYVRLRDRSWHWLAVGQPTGVTNEVRLVGSMSSGESREFLLYLPLYNGVRSVEIGVPDSAKLDGARPWRSGDQRPMVFYGTSIVHGACASRPGMSHPALLGRRFQRTHINLGFSGSGRMEPAMAELMSEIDASVYVLDCLPNMTPQEVRERVVPFVNKLRAARPGTPILLVEDREYADSILVGSQRVRNEGNHAALRQAWVNLRRAGVKKLYYLEAANLLGRDGEATVDGSHPSDLGFMRQAEAHARVLKRILE